MIKKISFNKVVFFISFAFILFFFIKSIYVPWTFFKSGYYGFYDLGLISDFLANPTHGKSFFSSEYGVRHLSIHWTPTLFLLIPFFSIFKSQFLLVLISNIACMLGITYFFSYIYQEVRKNFNNTISRFFLTIFFIFLFFSNKYINANFLAGHFEIFAIPLSLITLTMLLKNKQLYLIIIPFLLTLGVRQDVGFFLFFQLISLLFIPKYIVNLSNRTKINIIILTFISVLYVVLSLKFFLPLMGAAKNLRATQFWGQWGNSWGEIIINAITHPILIFKTIILHSGFTNFNEAFCYLGLFNPLQWLFIQMPGVIFYLAETTDKNQLHWYNSAFLLPGVYISTYVGLFVALKFLFNKGKIFYSNIILFALMIIAISKIHRAIATDDYKTKTEDQISGFNKVFTKIYPKCESKPISFSTDNIDFVFLNNHFEKYLVDHYYKAQIVIFSKLNRDNFQSDKDFNDYSKIVNVTIPQDKNLNLLYKDDIYTVYNNKNKINCY